jgi:hypothetical protein
MKGPQIRASMKLITWMLVIIIILAGNSIGCSSTSNKSPTPTGTGTAKATTSPTPTAFITKLSRPSGAKAQEYTCSLKPPTSVYNLAISLSNGETLGLDWKYVGTGQMGIRFIISTPEGRELNAKLQPYNLAGHPFYDTALPTQKLEEAVGGHLEINVGQDKYCGEGIYTLIYNTNSTQNGNIYLNYSLISAGK